MSKKIFLFGLIGISILFAGCTKQDDSDDYLNQYKMIPEIYKSNVELKSCLTTSLNSCVSNIVTIKATEAMDESICDDIKDPDFKNKCVGSIKTIQAIQKKDISACDGLTDELLYNCEFDIYNIQALEKMDIDICNDIQPKNSEETDGYILFKYEEARKACANDVIVALAAKNLDESICDDLDDPFGQEFCKDNVTFEKETQNTASQETSTGLVEEVMTEEETISID